mgnify:CR=1 FL=1
MQKSVQGIYHRKLIYTISILPFLIWQKYSLEDIGVRDVVTSGYPETGRRHPKFVQNVKAPIGIDHEKSSNFQYANPFLPLGFYYTYLFERFKVTAHVVIPALNFHA